MQPMELCMCDYSLELYRSRPATKNETVTLHRFPSGTMGFVGDRAMPVGTNNAIKAMTVGNTCNF